MIELDLWVLAGLIEVALLALVGFAKGEGARLRLRQELDHVQRELTHRVEVRADAAHEGALTASAPRPNAQPHSGKAPSSPPTASISSLVEGDGEAAAERPLTPVARSAPPPPPARSLPPPAPPAPPPKPEPVLLEAKDGVALLESHIFGPSADELAMLEDVVESAAQKLAREHAALKKTITSLEALVSSHSTLSAAACALIEADGTTEPQIAELNRIATGLTEAEHALSDATSEAQDTDDSLNALLRSLQPYTKEGGYAWAQDPAPPHLAINHKIMERAHTTTGDAQASLRSEMEKLKPSGGATTSGSAALDPGEFGAADDATPAAS